MHIRLTIQSTTIGRSRPGDGTPRYALRSSFALGSGPSRDQPHFGECGFADGMVDKHGNGGRVSAVGEAM